MVEEKTSALFINERLDNIFDRVISIQLDEYDKVILSLIIMMRHNNQNVCMFSSNLSSGQMLKGLFHNSCVFIISIADSSNADILQTLC